jgi:hypothetical protein
MPEEKSEYYWEEGVENPYYKTCYTKNGIKSTRVVIISFVSLTCHSECKINNGWFVFV